MAEDSGRAMTLVETVFILKAKSFQTSRLSDRSDVTHRFNKALGAFDALFKELFGTKCSSYEAKR